MASVENSDYDKLVRTINALEELVAEADAGRRFLIYREQCKEMVHEFMHMRDSMSIGADGESTPILRELFRMACAAKRELDSCICEDQTSWLQAALTQDDMTVFEIIRADLKWGFQIFLEVGNSSTAERARCDRARESLFNNDKNHLIREVQVLSTDNAVPELDRRIAKFLLARFNNEEVIHVYFADHILDSGEAWYPNQLDQNNLGDGSFATVQATRWLGIKLARKRFFSGVLCLNEVLVMSKLKHPNVVRFISCSRVESPVIIMECVEMTLDEYLKNRGRHNFEDQGAGWLIRPTDGRAPFGAALDQILVAVDIMYQISVGMAYLHGQKVAHLDLKPSNILLNKCNEGDFNGYVHVKIADMGLSKTGIEDYLLIRNSNPNRGTTIYRAPEIFKKGKFVCMKKADLYAFAIICWEILHGVEPLLTDVKLSEYRQEVKRGRRLEIDPNVCPDYLEKLIRECWHKNPNRRPSFSACSLALQSYKAKLLGSEKESLFDFIVSPETFEEKIKRLWRILILHVRQRRICGV